MVSYLQNQFFLAKDILKCMKKNLKNIGIFHHISGITPPWMDGVSTIYQKYGLILFDLVDKINLTFSP